MSHHQPKWCIMDTIPFPITFCKTIKINEHEFILISSVHHGILKYHIHQQKWSKLVEYPSDINISLQSMNYNKLSKQLIFFQTEQEIKMLDLKRLQWKPMIIINNNYPSKTKSKSSGVAININGTIHLIGGYLNTEHVTLAQNYNTIKKIYDFRSEIVYSEIKLPSLIYVSSKNILILIGSKNNNGIWIYRLHTNKWNKIENIAFNFYYVSSALSSDERYIIIAGGLYSDSYEAVDIIHVLDIRNDEEYILKQSKIKCPMKGVNNLEISGGIKDEILVIGWIKQIFNSSHFKYMEMPPIYIMQLIANWYNQEMLHWTKTASNFKKHYCIKTKHIVTSIVE